MKRRSSQSGEIDENVFSLKPPILTRHSWYRHLAYNDRVKAGCYRQEMSYCMLEKIHRDNRITHK